MSTKTGWRGWHTWFSIVLALPIAIVSLTAIFIAHDKALGLKEIPVAASWLPGYAMTPAMDMAPEVRSVHRAADGTDYVATKYGLFTSRGGALAPVEALGQSEIRDLAASPDGTLYAAGKMGLWRGQSGNWEKILPGEMWSVAVRADNAIAVAVKERGLVVSADGGRSWVADAALRENLGQYAMANPKPLTLNNLVMDLHTGKAFLGKTYEWVWIDIIGATMVFLCFSGLVIWWRSRRQKLKASMAVMPSPAHS